MTDSARAVKPAARRAVSRAQAAPRLYEGDELEFSLTAEIKHPRHGTFWAKTGGKTTIRPGETSRQARDRLRAFCIDFLDDTTKQIIN